MEPTPAPTETKPVEAFDVTDAGDQNHTSPNPAQEATRDKEHQSARVPSQPRSMSVADEIQFLKRRVKEIEKQTIGGGCNSVVDTGGPDINPSAEQIEYQKMLNCLYGHRKEWEDRGGPLDWDLRREFLNTYVRGQSRDGPWDFGYTFVTDRKYNRPDPFDPTHKCNSQPHNPNEPDEYDLTIDFGYRRENIRKQFEWEMDRLYLAEEFHKRKLEQKIADELERTQTQKTKATNASQSKTIPSSEHATQEADGNEPEATVMEPKLTRSQWHAFKQFALEDLSECQIDVLVGEPVVEDHLVASYAAWYGYSGHIPQKAIKAEEATTLMAPGETPLPERVRIRSPIIINILAKIVGSDCGSLSDRQHMATVFIRPFKMLTYCEPALRDWCIALKKKYASIPAVEGETPAGAAASTEPGDHVTTPPAIESRDDRVADRDRRQEDDKGVKQEEKDEDESTTSAEALKHLECLLQFINTDLNPKRSHLGDSQCRKVFFSDLWHLFRPGMEVISSNGKQVYRVVHVCTARHRVVPAWQRYHESANNKSAKPPFSLTCVYIDFDGVSLGPVSVKFEFKRFDGQRDIASLDVYPLQFQPVRKADFDEQRWVEIETLSPSERSMLLRERLVDRGRLFLEVAQVKHMYYAGPTVGARDEVESQVVVDFETAFAVEDPKQQEWKPVLEILLGNSSTEEEEESGKGETCGAICCRQENVHDDMYIDRKQRTEYIDSLLPKSEHSEQQPSIAIIPRPLKDLRLGPDKSLAVTTDELVIMSYRVFGFILRTRKWAQLDLSYLTDVHRTRQGPATPDKTDHNREVEEPNTFDSLVLNDKHKDMILSLIAQHFRDKKSTSGQREQVDIVRGKGKGLILLLHGAPGVGKTSTAEGVAERFKKPLFQITCGDLGTTAAEVEKALETTFALANRWDCILLLDEADVFLSQRTKEDFQRNGLVAVFLRVMEYYAGILFLTTNRVGDFDEAFTSRIHVSLYYPDLSGDQTAKIFELNLGMIENRFRRRGRQIEIDKVDIIRFADKYFTERPNGRWNGRQIRNACQTALALAEYEAQKAQSDDLQDSVQTDATVKLTVAHFIVVSKAYLEFIDYINQLFGTNSKRRAHENQIRAFLADPANDNIVASLLDRKAAFAQSVQPQQPLHSQQPQYPPPAIAGHANPYYGYNQPGPAPPATYLNPNSMAPQRQAYDNPEAWSSMPQPGLRDTHTPEPTYLPSQHSPQTRMQIPRTTQYSNQPAASSYGEPESLYAGQELASGLPPAANRSAPGQGWQREVGRG
ncbi:hypothetical protein BJY01DRAFT_40597 [Aspergillus pseudoustus]|uniref:AAA+ ATPase domain-containing protein n=1 Tax=Aspergillus pseudoustus TaxID=1810923 RepID=A0ABR4JCA5_9EURO